jgi:hypothetical protein
MRVRAPSPAPPRAELPNEDLDRGGNIIDVEPVIGRVDVARKADRWRLQHLDLVGQARPIASALDLVNDVLAALDRAVAQLVVGGAERHERVRRVEIGVDFAVRIPTGARQKRLVAHDHAVDADFAERTTNGYSHPLLELLRATQEDCGPTVEHGGPA